jgi:GNAT superfamily N-acetyltransferase
MTPWKRLRPILDDMARYWTQGGTKAVFTHIKKRVFERNQNLLYELPCNGVPAALPEGWALTVVRVGDEAGYELLRQVGGEFGIPKVHHRAVAYVMTVLGEPVGVFWHFPANTLARRMGRGTAYVGRAFVRPAWRGQGVNPRILAAMASTMPPGTRLILEIAKENLVSQKSMARGGCKLVGMLTTFEVLGLLVGYRIESAGGTD